MIDSSCYDDDFGWVHFATGRLIDEWRVKQAPKQAVNWSRRLGVITKQLSRAGDKKAARAMEVKGFRCLAMAASRPTLILG